MIALLSLLLAAAPVAAEASRTRSVQLATATVTIIKAEPIKAKQAGPAGETTDRQFRNRDTVPMVEFY